MTENLVFHSLIYLEPVGRFWNGGNVIKCRSIYSWNKLYILRLIAIELFSNTLSNRKMSSKEASHR